MTTPDIPTLERPAFFDGQLLAADDLGAMYDFHRQVRWLHNRALHNWGIAVGLDASGAKGDRVVLVTAGYAIDCQGHDVVLSTAQTLAVPPIAGAASGGPATLYLTVSYASDDQLPISESRAGSCATEGAVRRDEAPLLRWQDPADVWSVDARFRRGLDLVIATAKVQGCRLAAPLSVAERRESRAATQPYIAAGITTAKTTMWKYFPSSGSALGVETIVDTSDAGFQSMPVYSAQVTGARVLKNGSVADGFVTLDSPSTTQFTLRVLMPRNLGGQPHAINADTMFKPALLDSLRDDLGWRVSWMGVEG
ncbi:MAG TPA: hypothetical protein VGO46_13770 [Gemmatimonadaceae bacterium]|jgi:hypothetical protein|nr:hypothetical protein [Gemmatimonadaceae bacterium]